jgi:hypothetical protein
MRAGLAIWEMRRRINLSQRKTRPNRERNGADD